MTIEKTAPLGSESNPYKAKRVKRYDAANPNESGTCFRAVVRIPTLHKTAQFLLYAHDIKNMSGGTERRVYFLSEANRNMTMNKLMDPYLVSWSTNTKNRKLVAGICTKHNIKWYYNDHVEIVD